MFKIIIITLRLLFDIIIKTFLIINKFKILFKVK